MNVDRELAIRKAILKLMLDTGCSFDEIIEVIHKFSYNEHSEYVPPQPISYRRDIMIEPLDVRY